MRAARGRWRGSRGVGGEILRPADIERLRSPPSWRIPVGVTPRAAGTRCGGGWLSTPAASDPNARTVEDLRRANEGRAGVSVRIVPARSGKGFEYDIRITWPEGGRLRERGKCPVTGEEPSRRWGEARERAIMLQGKGAYRPLSAPDPALAEAVGTSPNVPTLETFRCGRLQRGQTEAIDHVSYRIKIALPGGGPGGILVETEFCATARCAAEYIAAVHEELTRSGIASPALKAARGRSEGTREGAAKMTVADWYDGPDGYYTWRASRARGAEDVNGSRGIFRKWIAPRFADFVMRDVTRETLEQFAEWLDEQVAEGVIAAKSAGNIWGEITVGFAFATRGKNKHGKNLSLRVLDVNPAETAAGPDGGTDKQKPFLRPDEVVRLLSCELVPLERRQVYAVAIYTAMRQGELRALRVRDVDFEAMQITVTRQLKNGREKARTKTGRARIVQIEPNLVPLLRMLVEGKGGDERVLSVRAHNRCASHLREDLLVAKCTRDALHVPKSDPLRVHIKFHNLRDTCLTHMSVRRDPPQDVQWRAGHTTSTMTEAYIVNARYEAGANFGVPLGPLPQAMIERAEAEVTHRAEKDARKKRLSDLRQEEERERLSPCGPHKEGLAAPPTAKEPMPAGAERPISIADRAARDARALPERTWLEPGESARSTEGRAKAIAAALQELRETNRGRLRAGAERRK